MKPKTKRILQAVTLVTAFAIAAGLLWKKQPPPQTVALPKGMEVPVGTGVSAFVGVTYGTRHVQPGLAARLVSKVPSPVTNLVQRALGRRLGPITSFRTPQPSLCVWFKTAEESSPTFLGITARLADDRGLLHAWTRQDNLGNGNIWSYAVFQDVPEHSRELECVLYTYMSALGLVSGEVQYSRAHEVGRVRFPNPVYGKVKPPKAEQRRN